MGRRRRRRRRKKEREQAITHTGGFAGSGQPGSQIGLPSAQQHSVQGARGALTCSRGSVVTPHTSSTYKEVWTPPEKKTMSTRMNVAGVLRLSPKARAKLEWFRDRGATEISGFGLSYKDELLYVADFITIKQKAGAASVEFDDDALNDYLKNMVAVGWHPSEVLRIWLHTHPGNSAEPSSTDMDTFRNVFGGSDWAIMAILAKGGDFKARVRFNNGPGGEMALNVRMDMTPPFDGVSQEDYEKWETEYVANILTRSYSGGTSRVDSRRSYQGCGDYSQWDDSDWRGWSDYEWNRGENVGTEGFASTGSDRTKFRDSKTSSIFHQAEIPEWGGAHRLESGEKDPKKQLVSGSVEQVWQIEEYKEGSIVITDFGWYEYPPEVHIYCKLEDDVDCLDDIALDTPEACGEIAWRYQDGYHSPMKITRVLRNGVIDLREDEEAAELELGLKTAGESSGSPGFGAPSATEEAESKHKTEVIDTAEVRKELETTDGGSAAGSDSGASDGKPAIVLREQPDGSILVDAAKPGDDKPGFAGP